MFGDFWLVNLCMCTDTRQKQFLLVYAHMHITARLLYVHLSVGQQIYVCMYMYMHIFTGKGLVCTTAHTLFWG